MKDNIAVVIGGAGGIGSAICKRFAAQHVKVLVADMDVGAANILAASIRFEGGDAIANAVDVTDENSVVGTIRCVVEKYGRLDYLVYCAGNNIKTPTLQLTLDQWKSALDTHLTGAFLFCREAGKQMVEQGRGGRIVLVSSVAAMSPIPERGAYGPSKAGLVNLAGMLSLEWAKYGINVNAVCPGVAATPMTQMVYERDPELREQRLKRMPLGREVLPEEIADLALFLCGSQSTYISGTAVPIDGGFLNSGFFPEPERT